MGQLTYILLLAVFILLGASFSYGFKIKRNDVKKDGQSKMDFHLKGDDFIDITFSVPWNDGYNMKEVKDNDEVSVLGDYRKDKLCVLKGDKNTLIVVTKSLLTTKCVEYTFSGNKNSPQTKEIGCKDIKKCIKLKWNAATRKEDNTKGVPVPDEQKRTGQLIPVGAENTQFYG